MFPTRYFSPRYWAERYWPKTGASVLPVIGGHIEAATYATAGAAATVSATAGALRTSSIAAGPQAMGAT